MAVCRFLVFERKRAPRLDILAPALALLLQVLLLAGCVHTAPFRDSNGHIIPESIATMEDIMIDGVTQRIWFRGVDKSKPALILLHGGPGASEAALFRHYNAELERHFLVVYWNSGAQDDRMIPIFRPSP